ncbi:MAG: hypothetical protein IKC88_04470 [Opitutales bacterium]|nr:hypothetical protein [Opitutales bacterium]
MKSKYTFVYNADLETLLDSLIERLKERISQSSIRENLQFVVFGGGYGRGEGGIYESSNGATLYNDLDFFVLANDDASNADLNEIDSFFATLSQEFSEMVKIDVDFSKAVKVSYASARMDIMSWREMALCRNVVFGDLQAFEKIFILNSDKTEVVESEIMKLAMNRFSGLLYASQKLFEKAEMSESDADFIARNINKALFASGDIYLAKSNNLPFKISSRLLEIQRGYYPEDIKIAYKNATDFKAFPKIHFSKSDYEYELKSAFALLKKAFCENKKYLQKRNFKRRIKDFITNIKLFKDFAKFKKLTIFADPKLTLSLIAIELIENAKTLDKSAIADYKNIWNKLS